MRRLGQLQRDLLGLLAAILVMCVIVATGALVLSSLWSWVF